MKKFISLFLLTVVAVITLSACNVVRTVTLKYTAGEGGYIEGEAIQYVEVNGNGSTVVAVANEGYYFLYWSDGLTASSRTDMNVTEDATVTALFAEEVKESSSTIIPSEPQPSESVVPSTTPSESQPEQGDSEYISISNAEELLAFSQNVELNGKYKLTADIDLEGYEMADPVLAFSGEFDGNGHVIKNAILNTSSPKVGVLFASIKDATIKNLKFQSCFVSTTSESASILTGLVSGGENTFTNIEFSNCGASTTNNYCGLLFARNYPDACVINIDGLTIKNSSFTDCSQYGGFVAGDVVSGTVFNMTNAQITGEFKTSKGNGSFIVGRNRKADVSISNTIVDAKLPSSQIGVFSSGNSANNVELTNCVVLNAEGTSYPFSGKKSETLTINNVYSVDFDAESNVSGVTKIAENDVTTDWYFNTLGLSADLWEVEGDSIKLKYASSNLPSEGAVIEQIALATGAVQTYFYTNDEFNANGLTVIAKYSDGVQAFLTSDQYIVDDSNVDMTKSGQYEIIIKVDGVEATASYSIIVREIIGAVLNVDFAKKIYVVGNNFSTNEIYVYSKLSDGTEIKLDASQYTLDSSLYNAETAGTYTISIQYQNFNAATFEVVVVEGVAQPVNSQVAIVVDGSISSLYEVVNGYPTFKTVSAAMDYINSCGYEDSVEKVVYIMDGEYREKVTVAANNVTFIGESIEGTVIVTNLIEDSVRPQGGTYGLDCASVQVNGSNFTATNLTISNDFDYVNDASKYGSPQGLALTINGDQATIFNMTLYGNQDTLYIKSGRLYAYNCLISGNVDFIFGNYNGIGYFDNCEIRSTIRGVNQKNGGYITAMKASKGQKPQYGYVFNECKLTAEEGVLDNSVGLGRTWGTDATCAYINCEMGSHIAVAAYGNSNSQQARWNQMNNYNPADADFVEYGSTGPSAISEAVYGGSILTAEQAANYNLANTMGTTNGDISWKAEFNPTSVMNKVAAYVTFGSIAAPQIGAAKIDNDVYYMFNGQTSSTGTSYTYDQNVQKAVLEWNGLTIDATSGKLTARTSDSQFNQGAKISVDVVAGTEFIIESYPNYHYYTVNGVAVEVDKYSVTFDADTTVVVEATNTSYIYSIILIVPDEEVEEEKPVVVDNDVYYMFNGQTSDKGTSYTYDAKIEKATGTLGDLTIDATNGKLAYNTSGYTQFNQNTTITFDVVAGTEVIIESYPGQFNYTLNDVAADANVFSQTYNANTTVVIKATATAYIYSIILIVPDGAGEEETPELQEVVYEFNANNLEVKAYDYTETFFDFFTGVGHADGKTKVTENKKTIDEIEFTQRYQIGGKTSAAAGYITFTVENSCTLVVYAMSGSSGSERPIMVWNDAELSNLVASEANDGTAIGKLSVELAAGTYYIGCTAGAINVYGIYVTTLK